MPVRGALVVAVAVATLMLTSPRVSWSQGTGDNKSYLIPALEWRPGEIDR